MKIGYTQGTYDLFHIGHLNLLEHAKEQCDYLIVGVNSDELVKKYKNKAPIFSQEERLRIVGAIKAVDEVFLCHTLDKVSTLEQHHFDTIYIGDDWKGNERWKKTEEALAKFNVNVEYLPYTKGVSSTFIRNKIEELLEKRVKNANEHDRD